LVGEEIFGLEAASLFAKPLNVGFGIFAGPCDALVVACGLDVNDKTLLIGGTNGPPIGESRIGKGE
jgi:hypothetical protein